MCTLTIAWRVFEGTPVVVGANRDETLGRPSSPPDRYAEDPTVFAPRDEVAGGTWIGFNECGLFAGITNRWLDGDVELAGDRSRGGLVADVLACESVGEATARIEREVRAREYDGFLLVVADAEEAICATWNGTLELLRFDPGVHVVVNVAVDKEAWIPDEREKAARQQVENARAIRSELGTKTSEGSTVEEWLARAGSVLGDHEYGACVHGCGFGTRSSSLIATGDRFRYAYSDGPPCRTPYEPLAVEGQF